MDEEKIEPYDLKMPRLGKAIARGFLTFWVSLKAMLPARVGERWGKLVAFVQRNYLTPVYLIAFCLTPFWAFLLFKVVGILFTQISQPPPVEPDALRAHFYSLGLTITGLGAILAAPFILIKAWVNERQATTAEQGLITDRITKAVEQLGAEKTVYKNGEANTEPNLEVRLGALYALERIAEDSERDHIPIMETLCAYIRENSKATPPEDFPEPEWIGLKDYSDEAAREAHLEKRRERFGSLSKESEAWKWAHALPEPRADIQAALRIIGRRSELRLAYEKRKEYQLDLRAANLQLCDLSPLRLGPALLTRARLEGANLSGAEMEGAYFYGAEMEGANLSGAKMEGANLRGAKMEGADLYGAEMQGADLREAEMEGADLSGAKMEGADLREAKMEGTDLSEAKMEGANLSGAKMEGADLREAKMEGADLGWAKMEGAYLREAKMEGANLYGAILKSADLAFWTCARIKARSADFTEAKNMTQDQVNSLFGDHKTSIPALGGDGEPLYRTTLLDREPLKNWYDDDPDYDAWLAAGAPPGTPIVPDP